MSINVNRDVQDIFYRYKMPRLMAKVEGRGNGIKTVIPNMVDIAKALERPPEYPTKFFGCELGAQTQMDAATEKYIVNGEHTADRLQELLHVFIRKFVLCSGCDNPETTLTVILSKNKKEGKIEQVCAACGHRHMLEMIHKLTTYIVNHPPAVESTDDKKKQTKQERREQKTQKKDEGATTATTATPQKSSKKSSKQADDDADDDVDWGDDATEEAVRKRQEDLSGGVASLTMTDDLEKSKGERLDLFFSFVDRLNKAGGKIDPQALVTEADRLDCREKAVLVLASVFWSADDDKVVLTKMKDTRAIFVKFTRDNEKAQRYVLGALEKLVEGRDSLLAKVPTLLNRLYEDDIVEEAVFFSWAEKVSKKYVSKDLAQKIHEKAASFIEWLKQADEESEEDEEDDKPAQKSLSSSQSSPSKATTDAADHDDDDDDGDGDDGESDESPQHTASSFQKDDEEEIDIDAI